MADVKETLLYILSRIDLRRAALILFLLLTSTAFIYQRLTRRKRLQEESFPEYEKNAEGLYPWEADTDDSPTRIPKDAKRYVNQHQPRRGRW